MTSQQGKCSEH